MKFRFLVVGAMFLAGCASRQSLGPSDTKNQSDNDRFRDLYECERDAALADAGNQSQAFATCMKARGYMQK